MISEKTIRVVSISSIMLVVLFKFQNCGPVTSVAGVGSVGINDSEVRVVDRWGQQKLSFVSSDMILEPAQSKVNLQGLCLGEKTDQKIIYDIISTAGSSVQSKLIGGLVDCVMGGFEISLEAIQFSSCDNRLKIRAARVGAEEEFAEAIVRPNCESI